jgi:hypothetical protein
MRTSGSDCSVVQAKLTAAHAIRMATSTCSLASLSGKVAKLVVGRALTEEDLLGVDSVESTFSMCFIGFVEMSILWSLLLSGSIECCWFAISGIANFDFIIIDLAADLSVLVVHYC